MGKEIERDWSGEDCLKRQHLNRGQQGEGTVSAKQYANELVITLRPINASYLQQSNMEGEGVMKGT